MLNLRHREIHGSRSASSIHRPITCGPAQACLAVHRDLRPPTNMARTTTAAALLLLALACAALNELIVQPARAQGPNESGAGAGTSTGTVPGGLPCPGEGTGAGPKDGTGDLVDCDSVRDTIARVTVLNEGQDIPMAISTLPSGKIQLYTFTGKPRDPPTIDAR